MTLNYPGDKELASLWWGQRFDSGRMCLWWDPSAQGRIELSAWGLSCSCSLLCDLQSSRMIQKKKKWECGTKCLQKLSYFKTIIVIHWKWHCGIKKIKKISFYPKALPSPNRIFSILVTWIELSKIVVIFYKLQGNIILS
jgi:hypothetical protein